MSIYLKVQYKQDISWVRHPLRRLWVNHCAKKIASHMQFSVEKWEGADEATLREFFINPQDSLLIFKPNAEKLIKRSTSLNEAQKTWMLNLWKHSQSRTCSNVWEYRSSDMLGSAASYLRKAGVTQIVKAGKGSRCKVEEGDVMTLGYAEAHIQRLALVQKTIMPRYMKTPRTFATIEGEEAPAHQLFHTVSPHTEVKSYNMAPKSSYWEMYNGPPPIIDPSRPEVLHESEGQLGIYQAVCPQDKFWVTAPDPAGLISRFPDVVLVDAPAKEKVMSPHGVINGGLLGGVNFGLRRLYHLIFFSAQVIKSQLARIAGNNYTIVLGRPEYIKHFGVLTVGEKTLTEFTQHENPKSQFMVLTRPPSGKRSAFAMVERATGKVKYIFPAAVRREHMKSLMKKMSAKAAAGIKGAALTRALEELEQDRGLTEDERAQLPVFRKMASQPDVWGTEWEFMDVVEDSFVAQKEWLYRLNKLLRSLSEKYRDDVAGKEMARILRQIGDKYNLKDLVYLAMFSSDQGEFEAGFVGKFSQLRGRIDPRYLQDIYTGIRETVFKKAKIHAINLGESAEVIDIGDEELVMDSQGGMLRRGEYAKRRMEEATVTYSRRLRGKWRYWRELLGIPLTRRAIVNSYIGRWQRRWHWLNPQSWIHAWRRDQVIINSTVGDNINLDGKRWSLRPGQSCYLIGTSLISQEPVDIHGELFGIGSRAQLGKGLNRHANGVYLQSYDNVGPANGDTKVESAGFFGMTYISENLSGSGVANRPQEIKEPFNGEEITRNSEQAAQRRDRYKALVINNDMHLSPDSIATRHTQILRDNSRRLRTNATQDPRRYFDMRRRRG